MESAPGIECPSRHKRQRKPTSEQTIQELYAELDHIEAECGAAIASAASGSNDADDSRELEVLGLTTWGPGKR